MAFASYQINVYSCVSGDIVQIFDPRSLYEVRYEKVLNDVGKLAMTLPYQDGLETIFALDNLIDILRIHPVTNRLAVDETYLVRTTNRFRQGSEEMFVVGGLSLNHLLMRRLIDPTDDPLAAGGYSTKAGAADVVMTEYVDEQAGPSASANRQIPGLSLSPTSAIGNPVGGRERYTGLLSTLQRLGRKGVMDFNIQHVEGTTLRFSATRIGEDKTRATNYPGRPFVLLSPDLGNMDDPNLLIDRKQEGTTAYVMGEGDGENRTVLIHSNSHVADSPYNRIEFQSDARNTDKGETDELLTAAYAAVASKLPEIKFTFLPVIEAAGLVYQQDWIIGDYVTARWDMIEQDVRITGVEIQLDSSGEGLEMTIEEPVLT